MRPPKRSDGPPFFGRSFGLDLEVDFACDGLPASFADVAAPRVRLELAPRTELAAVWPARSTRLRTWGVPGQRPVMTLDGDEGTGYLFRVKGSGWFHVTSDGRFVRCAPVRTSRGRWQRSLIGQVLPFVAVLRGLETYHASAVSVEGGAFAFVGGSGSGKSSLALSLVMRGARLITDDVMAVMTDGSGAPRAHHGFELANVRFDALNRLTPAAIAELGPQVDEDDEGIRIRVDVAREPVPLAAICFLDRSSAGPLTERIQPADPRLLLGATYNVSIREPDRLIRQLDMCATLARRVPTFRIRIPADRGPQEIVREIVDEVMTDLVAS